MLVIQQKKGDELCEKLGIPNNERSLVNTLVAIFERIQSLESELYNIKMELGK